MGGSGSGNGGIATLDAAFPGDKLATILAVPRSAPFTDVPVAARASEAAVAALADFTDDAPPAMAAVASGALAPGSVAAAGMLALAGAAEKVLDGKGGRDGTPTDEALEGGGLRGGICGSLVMLTLVLFASA